MTEHSALLRRSLCLVSRVTGKVPFAKMMQGFPCKGLSNRLNSWVLVAHHDFRSLLSSQMPNDTKVQ